MTKEEAKKYLEGKYIDVRDAWDIEEAERYNQAIFQAVKALGILISDEKKWRE